MKHLVLTVIVGVSLSCLWACPLPKKTGGPKAGPTPAAAAEPKNHGQERKEEVHERNEERKAEKDAEKAEKKAAKEEAKKDKKKKKK